VKNTKEYSSVKVKGESVKGESERLMQF